MERDQRSPVLWPDSDAFIGTSGGCRDPDGLWRDWDRAILSRPPGNCAD